MQTPSSDKIEHEHAFFQDDKIQHACMHMAYTNTHTHTHYIGPIILVSAAIHAHQNTMNMYLFIILHYMLLTSN